MTWIEWVEPFEDNDPVYMRVSRETAIKRQVRLGKTLGKPYLSEKDALDDFIVVNWASIRESKPGEM